MGPFLLINNQKQKKLKLIKKIKIHMKNRQKSLFFKVKLHSLSNFLSLLGRLFHYPQY